MSQEDVYKILKQLGSEATALEVRKVAYKNYPKRTLYLYVTNRLNKLKEKGIVEKIIEPGKLPRWRIVKKID